MLPYQGEQGSRLVKSLQRSIRKLLRETTQLEFEFIVVNLARIFKKRTKRYLNIIMMLFT